VYVMSCMMRMMLSVGMVSSVSGVYMSVLY